MELCPGCEFQTTGFILLLFVEFLFVRSFHRVQINLDASGCWWIWKRDPSVRPVQSSGFHYEGLEVPYILESNPHTFYSFRGLKNQMRIRIACGFDSRSWAGFCKNDRAAVRAVRTMQCNNLLFYLLFIILYNIYNLLFIRLAIITHKWISLPCRQGEVRIRTTN